jgi:hypothetical protein
MLKQILLFALTGICMTAQQGKAQTQTVNVNCSLDGDFIGQILNYTPPGGVNYDDLCDDTFPSPKTPHNDCKSHCAGYSVPSSGAAGPMQVVPAPLPKEKMETVAPYSTPTEEDRTQTYAPTYQPQEEQRQNFSSPQGEGPQIPTDPTRNLKLAPMNQDSLQE